MNLINSPTLLRLAPLIGIIFPVSCKTSESSPKAIIGSDELTPLGNDPLLALIGSIKGAKISCTFFVSAKDTITTATHCVADQDLSKLQFTLNGKALTVIPSAYPDDGHDVARLKLTRPLQKSLESAAFIAEKPARLVGFSYKYEQHNSCSLQALDAPATYFFHDCDTRSGMSGSPILQDGKVVGIHLGHFPSLNRNVALMSSAVGQETASFPFAKYVGEGSRCGSDSSVLGKAYKELTVDWWPDTGALSVLLDLGFGLGIKTISEAGCLTLGQAYFGDACAWHDSCYDGEFIPDINDRVSCDMGLRDRWVSACNSKYKKSKGVDVLELVKSTCRTYCTKTVEFMYEIQSKKLASAAGEAWTAAASARANHVEVTPNNSWSSDWENLGGQLLMGTAAVSWGGNRLDVFALGADQKMIHKWFDGNAWFGAWENQGGTFASAPAAASWSAGRLDVFGIGTDQALYHKWYDGISWFSDWERQAASVQTNVAAVSWGPSRLDVFAKGQNNTLQHRWFDGTQWNFDWEDLGGDISYGPAASSWGRDRLDVFALAGDGSLIHKWWDGTVWFQGWENLGGNYASAPAAVSWSANRIDVFVIGRDRAMHHKWFDGKAWFPGWENLGGQFIGTPSVASWGPGRLDVFGIGADGALYHRWYH